MTAKEFKSKPANGKMYRAGLGAPNTEMPAVLSWWGTNLSNITHRGSPSKGAHLTLVPSILLGLYPIDTVGCLYG